MKAITAIKTYFEADPHGRKVTMDEFKGLDPAERQELGRLACVGAGRAVRGGEGRVSMSTLDVLRAAREYITDPSLWTQHDYGNPGGRVCAVGALNLVAGLPTYADHAGPTRDAERLLGDLALEASRCESSTLSSFNDSHSHSEVLALFDRAIAVEEAKAAEFTTNTEPAEVVA